MTTKTLDFDFDFDESFKSTLGQDVNLTMVLDEDDLQPQYSGAAEGHLTVGEAITPFAGEMTVPRFVYENELGEGAYGKVWKASDTDIGRSVAIKTYKLTGNKVYRLCSSEFNIAAKIEHPNVPVLYDVEQDEDGQYHYIMKYIDGHSLEDIIQELSKNNPEYHARFHIEQRIEIVIQLLRVLATVHSNGIVHRDIKPENILVGPNGEAYLMDWGVALDTGRLSGEGQFVGTPLYMSPEQHQKQALDGRSDLYSIGSTLYELLTLKPYAPPFSTLEELGELVKTHHRQKADFDGSTTMQGKEIAMQYRKVIMNACHPDPNQRYQSATDFIRGLEDALSGRFDICCPVTGLSRFIYMYQRLLNTNPVVGFMGFFLGLFLFSAALIGIGILL